MAEDKDLNRRERDDALDPRLAAELRLAEVELRSRMTSGVWTSGRVFRLVMAVVVFLILGGLLLLVLKLRS